LVYLLKLGNVQLPSELKAFFFSFSLSIFKYIVPLSPEEINLFLHISLSPGEINLFPNIPPLPSAGEV